jgi:hypothetical protein
VWDELPLEAGWQSDQDRQRAVEALDRFLAWRAQSITGRTETERRFNFSLVARRWRRDARFHRPGGRLRGGGRVDFKTGSTVASVADAETKVTGVYQLALELDGPDDLGPAGGGWSTSGGRR